MSLQLGLTIWYLILTTMSSSGTECTVWPPAENICSLVAEDAGIAEIYFAQVDNSGNSVSCVFHHCSQSYVDSLWEESPGC